MIKEFRDVENAPLNVHLIDKSNNGERLIADLFLHRTVSWKPWALVWFTWVFACITTFSACFTSYVNPPRMSRKCFINLQFMKREGILLKRSPSKQARGKKTWVLRFIRHCNVFVPSALLSCCPAFPWQTQPSSRLLLLFLFAPSALSLLPTGHVWPSARHPPDGAFQLAAGRLSAQGKTHRDAPTYSRSYTHTHTETKWNYELFTEILSFHPFLVLFRSLIHLMCPQDQEASPTHSYRRTPG